VRTLVLTDVHADAASLDRVLRDAEGGWDRLALLGDLIGYGAEPVETVSRLRALGPVAAVRGNHEAMLSRALAGDGVAATPAVLDVLAAHAEALAPDDLAWVLGRPLRALLPADDPAAADAADDHRATADELAAELVHGSPDPDRPFDYLLGVPAARRAIRFVRRPLLLFGHTHVPGGFVLHQDRWRPISARREETRFDLPADARALLNPGSVAAARDGGPGGCYLIVDHLARTALIRRVGTASG